jgi:hypothetical protein
MVFEPVSIVGVVGTTAGLLGFLASTVEKLAQKRVEYKEHGRRLRWVGYQMNDCHEELERWGNMWCNRGDAYPANIYVYFWGEKGYKEMLGRFDLIEEEHQAIHDFFLRRSKTDCLRSTAEDHSTSSTMSGFQDWVPEYLDYGDIDGPGRFKKLTDVLHRYNTLQERIKRLREMIEGLHRRSRTKFFQLLRRADTGQSIRPLAEGLIEFDNRFKGFTRVMKSILDLQPNDEKIVHLVLQSPEDEGEICCQHCLNCLQKGMDIETKLVTKPISVNSSTRFEVKTIWYRMEEDETNALSDHSIEPPVPVHREFLQDHTVANLERYRGRLNRAKSAAGLANYALMLARTRIFYHLSIRRLYCMELEDGTTLPTFQPVQSNRDEAFRRSPSVYQLRFLQLGTTLAEIAIGQPIAVSLDNEGLPIFSKGGRPIREEALLREVSRRTLSASYSRTIKYCIDLQTSIQQRGYRIEDIEDSSEHILKP